MPARHDRRADRHAEIAVAALDAGKHVLCEKPLANSVDEARSMVAAAERARAAGVRSIWVSTTGRVPAVALARRLVAGGRIGPVRHVRASYPQDWIADLVTEPVHPYVTAWWPPGHGLGYEHTFTHEIVDLVRDVAAGADPVPSFADGLQVQLVLDAVSRSAAAGSQWKEIDR